MAMKKVSCALFRYAVYVDMMVQMLAENMNYTECDLKELQRKTYNNVRRTKGKYTKISTLWSQMWSKHISPNEKQNRHSKKRGNNGQNMVGVTGFEPATSSSRSWGEW